MLKYRFGLSPKVIGRVEKCNRLPIADLTGHVLLTWSKYMSVCVCVCGGEGRAACMGASQSFDPWACVAML